MARLRYSAAIRGGVPHRCGRLKHRQSRVAAGAANHAGYSTFEPQLTISNRNSAFRQSGQQREPQMNAATRRRAIFIAAPILLASVILALAGPAVAAPYGTTTLTVTVSNTNPSPGGPVTVTVTGASPGDPVIIDVDSAPIRIGVFTANPNGVASGLVAIPCGLSGAHDIVAIDGSASASAAITVGSSAAIGECAASTILASTGVDVEGLSALALSLLSSGGLLLCFGRRRVGRSS
jgi:hypothetical protein